MKKSYLLSGLLIFITLNVKAQSNQIFARFPAISPNGSKIAFSYEGDIWTVPIKGGNARRMTVNDAYETHPQWSPNGSKIAFNSNRNGNEDVFELNANGSGIKQLTYHSANDRVTGWTPDNRVIFTTKRIFNEIERDPEIQTVSGEGGTPSRYFNAFGEMARMTPNGRFMVFVRGNAPIYRKRYRGSANKDLWVYDTRNKTYHQLTDFKGNDMFPRFAGNHALYFISERDGTLNLYKTSFTDDGQMGSPEQLTRLKRDGVRYFDVSSDGGQIIFESKSGLYTFSEGKNPHKLSISVSIGERFSNIEHRTFTKHAKEFAVSPSGKFIAYVLKGDIFIKHNDNREKRSVKITDSPYRDVDVAFLNDSTLIFASDRGGQYDLYALKSADEVANLFESLQFQAIRLTNTKKAERTPVISPDGKKIAFSRGRGELIVASIEKGNTLGEEKKLVDNGWVNASGVAWSPDSKYLAYSLPGLNFNSEIYIQPADNSRQAINITEDPRADTDPVWSPDGKKLAFLTPRNNGDNDIWFAWLSKKDQQLSKLKWNRSKGETKSKRDTSRALNVDIDFDGLYKRLQQVTSLPGNESDINISKDGKTFYFVTNRSGRQNYKAKQNIYQVKWDGTDLKAITQNGPDPSNVRFGPKGKALYFMQGEGRIKRFNLNKQKLEDLPFIAEMSINHTKQREIIFEEAWRAIDIKFADPNFNGQDWNKLHDHYKPWIMKASSDKDFEDVMNMMIGELNSSHMGFRMPSRVKTKANIHTGLLGVEVVPVSNGVKVDHVVPNSPADREVSKLHTGDVITSVNGQSVTQSNNFYHLLENKVDKPIKMNIQKSSGGNNEIVIEPTQSLDKELYNEWVRKRKELTNKYSDGRLGYIHIQGMNWPSFEHFQRELIATAEGKDGIVIDVRYNGGGWTTDYVLTALNYRQHAYTIPRGATKNLKKNHTQFQNNYPFGDRLPIYSWNLPSIALANHTSYSNAEIFAHAFKSLNYGTLVGESTFGAVWTSAGANLLGGAYVATPYRAWYVKATNEKMELGPAVPDIKIKNAPDYRVEGDAQLKAAVDKLLQQIGKSK